MKQLLFIIFSLVLLKTCFGATIAISNCTAFNAMVANPKNYYYLTQSFSCSGINWSNKGTAFTGTIDGNGFTVSDLHITRQGLFNTGNGSTFTNITFTNFTSTGGNHRSGLFVGQLVNGTVSHVTVRSSYINVSDPDWDGISLVVGYVEAFIGFPSTFHDITVEDSEIRADNKLAFIVSETRSSVSFSKIVVRNSKITGTSSLISGVLGSVASDVNTISVVLDGVTLDNVTVVGTGERLTGSGGALVGGVLGGTLTGSFGYANTTIKNVLADVTVINWRSSTASSTGGLIGQATANGTHYIENVHFPKISIFANGTQAGGFFGNIGYFQSGSSCVTYVTKSGILDGEIKAVGQHVGGIAAKVRNGFFNEVYVRPSVTVASQAGLVAGLFGRWDVIANGSAVQYSYARSLNITGTNTVGGLFGAVAISNTISVYLTEVYSAVNIHNLTATTAQGLVLGDQTGGVTTHKYFLNKVYFDNSTSPFAAYKDTTSPTPIIFSGTFQAKSGNADLIATLQNDYTQSIWCVDRLRSEYSPTGTVCDTCGPFGQYLNEGCLCAAYTYPDDFDPFTCLNNTVSCVTPPDHYIAHDEIYELKTSVDHLYFENGNFILGVKYPSIKTGWTDVVIKQQDGTFVSSLSSFLTDSASSVGNWTQSTGSIDGTCYNFATWTVDWSQVSGGFAQTLGLYEFYVYAKQTLQREERVVTLKNVQIEPNVLVDVVPVSLEFIANVTTNATVATNFTLAFDIDLNYFVRYAKINPDTLELLVVYQSNISHPFYLLFHDLNVTINGTTPTNPTPVTAFANTSCPATFGADCIQEQNITFALPNDMNCTVREVEITFNYTVSCEGPNLNSSSTLCSSVYQTLNGSTTVLVKDIFQYNFCPKIEAPDFVVHNFSIYQNGVLIPEDGEVRSNPPINGTIIFDKRSTMNGTLLQHAKVVSLKLFETYPLPTSLPDSIDITAFITYQEYFFNSDDQLVVNFVYPPNFRLITTYLQEWVNGTYFEATVEILYGPGSVAKRLEELDERGVAGKDFKTSVRLQIPLSPSLTFSLSNPKESQVAVPAAVHTSKRVFTKSSNFGLNPDEVALVRKVNIDDGKDSQELKQELAQMQEKYLEEEKEQNGVILIVIFFGFALVVSLFAILFILKRRNTEAASRF